MPNPAIGDSCVIMERTSEFEWEWGSSPNWNGSHSEHSHKVVKKWNKNVWIHFYSFREMYLTVIIARCKYLSNKILLFS